MVFLDIRPSKINFLNSEILTTLILFSCLYEILSLSKKSILCSLFISFTKLISLSIEQPDGLEKSLSTEIIKNKLCTILKDDLISTL